METSLHLEEQMAQWFFGILKNTLLGSNSTPINQRFTLLNSMRTVNYLELAGKVDKSSFGI
jgi:hypothetical protein